MKLVPLNSIFNIEYGNQFDLYKMDLEDPEINFVSRSSQNLGVVARVSKDLDCEPYPAGLITVTLGGTYLLSSFVQQEPFYTAQNIKVLTPKRDMKFKEKIFYCMAIQSNRFRYTSHGREANVTLDHLAVPDEVPAKWLKLDVDELMRVNDSALGDKKMVLKNRNWRWFTMSDLFEIKKGKRLTKEDMQSGQTPFIGSSELDNGVTAYVDAEPMHEGNTITVAYDGSIGEAFYQPTSYWALDSVNVLYPKFTLNPYVAMFLVALIRKEKYRYSYGRKWHVERMNDSKIKLPVAIKGNPDWKFMEDYIKSLPYSASI